MTEVNNGAWGNLLGLNNEVFPPIFNIIYGTENLKQDSQLMLNNTRMQCQV